jgi:RHS repeat-associated protein
VHPDSTTKEFSYDTFGNLLQKTDSNGITTFTYNAIYQVQSVEYPDQSSVTFEYDPNGNRTLMVDEEGTTTSTYDSRNRCISETRTIETESYTMEYTYDAASRLISATYPDQSVITYEYDALSRLVTIPGYAQFMYNAHSLLEEITYGNGVTTALQYDSRNRTESIYAQKNGLDVLLMNYQYDPVGNTIQFDYGRRSSDQQWAQSTETFQYDWLNRLVSAQGDYGVLTYSYDSAGNRITLNDVTYTYNEMNELISMSDGTTFSYDEGGNRLEKTDGVDTWFYAYEKRNLLTQVEKNQQILAQYKYDGDGKRIKKTEWIESVQEYHTTIYQYSGINVTYEKNLNTGSHATYIYGPNGRIAKTVNGVTEYYHTDHLGSTRLITDGSGNVITDINYSPFGESVIHGEKESYLYTGKEKDVTGLYYFGSRYYDPGTGKFITRDIFRGDTKNPQSLNQYTYCLNNPIRYVDPVGFDEDDPVGFDGNDPGKIVEEIFKLLEGLSDEELGVELEDFETDKELFEFLASLVEKLGFECRVWERETDYGSTFFLQIQVEINGEMNDFFLFIDESDESRYGYSPPGENTIYINYSKHATVAELAATICHEMCHRVIEVTNPKLTWEECIQHNYIYPVHLRYIDTLAKDVEGSFTKEYIKAHDDFWEDIQKSRDCSESKGFCLGSVVLSIFMFLGLFLTRILKRE